MIIEGTLTDTSYGKLVTAGWMIWKRKGKYIKRLRWAKWGLRLDTIYICKTFDEAETKMNELLKDEKALEVR